MDKTLEKLVAQRTPTAQRPLMGVTVLVVEDSRFACDAIRLMCLRSGARIRRADSLRSASRHLAAYSPTAVIVDLGLPDGSGLGLIAELDAARPRIPVILGISGDTAADGVALSAGADAFLAKPITGLGLFQETILGHLPEAAQPAGPRPVPDEEFTPDPLAMRDDLAHAARILDRRTDGRTLDYVAQFVGGVAISARDMALLNAARGLDASCRASRETGAALGRLNAEIRARLDTAPAV